MIVLAIAATLALTPPAHPSQGPPQYPAVIHLDQPAYTGKDHITVSLLNRSDKSTWIQPLMKVERSNGDNTWTDVYRLWATDTCRRALPEEITECVELKPGQKLTLTPWDWNTGGYHQCPPRRPGHRALKGVHRITAEWCPGKVPQRNARPRVKLTTWE